MIRLIATCAVLVAAFRCEAASIGAHYVGPETCALCHRAIADQQEKTAMANTWQPPETSWLRPQFEAAANDDLPYRFLRGPSSFSYSVDIGLQQTITLPVTILMGGRRHGIGFLAAIDMMEGIPLARPALVQARYAWSMDHRKLLIAPGSAVNRPANAEAALGLALSPTFEARCIACHGRPNVDGNGKTGGVHCESCHGAGSAHLQTASQIINPKHLSNEQSIEVCARCHIGLTRFSDPAPQDLLVANQVVAIKSSECYIQSRQGFSCTACHDPHNDAKDDSRAIKACLGCHSASASKRAGICPVNSGGDCVRCHMPSVEMGPLHLVDHSIRVHPEQAQSAIASNAPTYSEFKPASEYIRVILTFSSGRALEAKKRLKEGQQFYDVAQMFSDDISAGIGGYWGRKKLGELPPELAEAAQGLRYGDTSGVIPTNGRYFILQRLGRDFRLEAEGLQNQAETMALLRKPLQSIDLSQRALKVYPHFLKAIVSIAAVYAQSGNVNRGLQVMTTAAKLYPQDAAVRYELGVLEESQGEAASAVASYRWAIDLDSDLTAAYIKLGGFYNSKQDWQSGIKTFRAGLQIDPLNAELYQGLATALQGSGDLKPSKEASVLATELSSVGGQRH